jgi:hypothetical protein
MAATGDAYISSSDVWYRAASGRFYDALKQGVPLGFNTVQELATYCKEIAPECCPVFGQPLTRGGKDFRNSPSIDRIDPRLGYMRGNIQIISNKANAMKQDATPTELQRFAEWVLK